MSPLLSSRKLRARGLGFFVRVPFGLTNARLVPQAAKAAAALHLRTNRENPQQTGPGSSALRT